jgi:MFS family permease
MLGLFFLSSPVLYVYRPIKSPLVRSWTDVSAFKDKAFLSVMCGAVFSAMVYYLPMLYLPLYGATAAKVHNDNLSFYLVSIANGASVFGRLLCGLVATAIGPIETCGLAVASSAVILYCWFAVLSPAGVIVWSAAWGFMSSAIVAMPGAIVPHLTPSVTLVGTRTGMLWAAVGVGMLIGSPIAGSLIEYNNGDNIHWWRAQLFASLSMTISAFFFLYSAIFVRIKASSASL